jgi:hypothetical protein
VSTKRQMRPMEVRRWRGACVAFRAKAKGVVSLMCCLQSERKRCRFVNVTGRFPMFSDWIREHKETNKTNGGASMAWCLCCLQGKRKGCKETNATRGGASMVGCLCCLQGETKRCRLVIVTWRFPMSSDSIR